MATCNGADSLINGHFELGPNQGWVESSSQSQAIVTDFAPISAYAGSWMARVGSLASEQSSVHQDVEIPAGVTFVDLSFRYRIETNESSIVRYDSGAIEIVDPATGNLLATVEEYDNGDQTNGWWYPRILDLRAYRGQTIRLRWTMDNDLSASTSYYLDEVELDCI